MFKISRLITTPNPGTNVFPAGTCAGEVFCVLPCEVVVGALTAGCDGGVLVLPDEAVGGGAAAGGGGASAGGGASGGGGAASTGGSGGGSGAGAIGITSGIAVAFKGLAGFTGLVILVGFVALFTQLFCDGIQSLHCGSLYGVEQVETLFSVIEPMKPS